MAAFFNLILSKLAGIVGWFGDLFVACFVALWDIGKDGVCWVLESMLDIAISTLDDLDVSGITTSLTAFGSLPAQVLEVCAALGLGTAFGIIAAAIGIRLVLQLIPFTRLGS